MDAELDEVQFLSLIVYLVQDQTAAFNMPCVPKCAEIQPFIITVSHGFHLQKTIVVQIVTVDQEPVPDIILKCSILVV